MTIDDLLSQPLQPVPDNGFSAKVIARIRHQEYAKLATTALLAAAAAALACVVLPIPALIMQFDHLMQTVSTSLEVGLGLTVVVAVLLIDRKLTATWD
jgi:hypothetical protein